MNDFMTLALENAKEAMKIGEVPVGCLFIYNNNIIARGKNLVNQTKNATRHAELICIDEVLKYCSENNKNYKEIFSEISIYVTVEPCIMCAVALNNLNVKEIVYGCKNDRFGSETILDTFKLIKSPIKIISGVKSDEAMTLLKEFYKNENPSAPIPKIKKK